MPGIGAFGSAMIPLGNAAGVGLSQMNQLQDRALRNNLAQQQMALQQKEEYLRQRQLEMQEAQTKFALSQEAQNVRQQQQATEAGAALFSSAGQLAKTPEERKFWDFAGNAAYNHLPPEYIMAMAKEMGFDQEVKQQLEMYHALYYSSGAALNYAQRDALNAMNPGGAGGAGTGGAGVSYGGSYPSAMTAPGFGTGALSPSGSLGSSAVAPFPALPGSGSGRPMMRPSAPLVAPSMSGYGGVSVPAGVPATMPGYGGSGRAAGPPPGARYSPTGDKYWDPTDGEIHDTRTGAVVGG